MTTLLLVVCSISFIGYGTACLVSPRMVTEFKRYGLESYRTLTGLLQLTAAVGLLLGLRFELIGGIAAAGLALQMACGLGVRVRIKDPWLKCLPAMFYMLACGWLAVRLL